MALNDKLKLFKLSPEETAKAEQKFLASLSLVSDEELTETINYLNSQDVFITKANQIKVAVNSKAELATKFSALSEVHETNIYRQDPARLNRNVIDLHQKIKYCIRNGINYKKEDGTYEPFLFSEVAWQKEFNKEDGIIRDLNTPFGLESEIVTVEPVIDPEFQFNALGVENPSLEETTNFETVKSELYDQLESAAEEKIKAIGDIKQDLADFKTRLEGLDFGQNEETISFNDIEPESYGMGRAA